MKPVAHARQVAMYLVRTLTTSSLPEIGKKFNKDHSPARGRLNSCAATMRSCSSTWVSFTRSSCPSPNQRTQASRTSTFFAKVPACLTVSRSRPSRDASPRRAIVKVARSSGWARNVASEAVRPS